MRRKKERRGAEKRAGLGGRGGEANLAGLDVPQPEVARAGHERAGAGQDAQRAQGMQVAAVHLRRET